MPTTSSPAPHGCYIFSGVKRDPKVLHPRVKKEEKNLKKYKKQLDVPKIWLCAGSIYNIINIKYHYIFSGLKRVSKNGFSPSELPQSDELGGKNVKPPVKILTRISSRFITASSGPL